MNITLELYKQEQVHISDLKGKTITKISKGKKFDKKLEIKTKCGHLYTMYHEQQCCENVWLADITGKLKDLIGFPIVEATATTSKPEEEQGDEETMYTFYKLNASNLLGGVCLRWCGTHNGYYSVEISIAKRKIYE
jgi:hypothetical protein